MHKVRIGIFDLFCCSFAFGICDRSYAAWSALGDRSVSGLMGLAVVALLFAGLLPFLNPRWK